MRAGTDLDSSTGEPSSQGRHLTRSSAASLTRPIANRRAIERANLSLPARLTWKDRRGSDCFASVITRNVGEFGVFVECSSPVSIALFRLVHFQVERDRRDVDGLPELLRHGRLLSAVYRIHPPTRAGGRQGLALRLLVDPRRHPRNGVVQVAPLEVVTAAASAEGTRATA